MDWQIAVRLILAFGVPTALGMALSRVVFGSQRPVVLHLAHGYLIGVLATLLLFIAYDLLGLPFHFWSMVGLLAGVTAVLVWRAARRPATSTQTTDTTRPPVVAWEAIVLALLLATTLLTLYLVFSEALLRPTYPFDAWRGWEPKAIQFFHNRALDAPMVTIGNHGLVSVLAQVWAMLAVGDSGSTLTHFPWPLAFVATGLAIYEFGCERYNRITGALAATAFFSMPLMATHAALAGYADSWLTLIVTLAAMALVEYVKNPRFRTGALLVVYAIACIATKRAGIGIGIIFLMALSLAALSSKPHLLRAGMLSVAIFLLLIILAFFGVYEIDIALSEHARLVLGSDKVSIPYVENFAIDAVAIHIPVWQALVEFDSWSLAAMLLPLVLIFQITYWNQPLSRRPLTLLLLTCLLYIGVYFSILAPVAALNHTGLSRAALPVMALLLLATIESASINLRRSSG